MGLRRGGNHRLRFVNLHIVFALVVVHFGATTMPAQRSLATEPAPVELNIAIFAYLPDASAGIEKLESKFEAYARDQKLPIDVDFELWDPYSDDVGDNGLQRITEFDLVEIDLCRLAELTGGGFGGLDPLPGGQPSVAADYVEPAKTVLTRTPNFAKYVAPHWVCGNFLVFWSSNSELAGVNSFDDFIRVMDPANGRPVLADIYGTTGLGEFYADALLDRVGTTEARQQLIALATTPDENVVLHADAAKAVLTLINEMFPNHRENLDQYHDHNYVYPRGFASNRQGALIGYSERTYYLERELELLPKAELPCLKPADVIVRPFPFASRSQGTPSWVDGFVVPKGKASAKSSAIQMFLSFVKSPQGFVCFAEPSYAEPGTYLLPAVAAAYDDTVLAHQPVLKAYRDQLDGSFPVDDPALWRGIKKAGKKIKSTVTP